MNYENFYQDKKVLITGGLGFIGSTLAHRLVELGAKVSIVDSLYPEYGGNFFNIESIKDKVTVNLSDIRNTHVMRHIIAGQDYIFNLAGTLSHIDSMNDPFTDLEINCVAQLSLLEACREKNPDVKVLFAGTRGEYGRARYTPVDEDHPLSPTDVNGVNNIAGEMYHILYNNVYNIRACSLRLTNTYGPRHQMKHHRQGIINWFIRQLIDGQKIKIYGDGSQIRDLNYVDDVVEAMLMAMSAEKTNGEVYNLGGESMPLREIVEKMIEANNGEGSYEIIPFPPELKQIEIGDYIANYSKIKKALGWEPKTHLMEGLKKTIAYYKKFKSYYW